MKQLVTVFLFAVFASLASAQQGSEAPALDIRDAQTVTLDEFLWKNRLVVVFANSRLDPSFQKQMQLLADRPADLIARDVVVITDTDPSAASLVRTRLRPRGFGLVLVDKDGIIKLRKPSPWDVREISRSIDKTDLRQQELRDQRNHPPAR